MPQNESVFEALSQEELAEIKDNATARHYRQGDIIFSEGDPVDYIYFIESGQVSIQIQKFTTQEEICSLGPSQYFGEMAVFYKDRRTATAVAATDAVLLSIDKATFLQMLQSHEAIGDNINKALARRNEELMLKEKLVASTGIQDKSLHVSIKGDPSMRESTFTRQRYESPVDKVLPQLSAALAELLLQRCIYEIFLHFNSGEVHVSSVFNPFVQEIHPANRLVDESYVDRHFPKISYEDKTEIIRFFYTSLSKQGSLQDLPGQFRQVHLKYYQDWQPVVPAEIEGVLSGLVDLRKLEDFYLRNVTISMTRDAIRMQFNCDGTHIVSSDDYKKFLQQNLISG